MARTNADKRKAVEVALREFPNLSNREIARICGVSYGLTHSVRDELINSISCDDTTAQPETRIGADGKERRMPIRKDPIPPMPEEEEEENEQEPEGEALPGEPFDIRGILPGAVEYQPSACLRINHRQGNGRWSSRKCPEFRTN